MQTPDGPPKIVRVVPLKRRPNCRFQHLGMVEAGGDNRRTAQASMLIRAAMMGAEAVVDSLEERLPGERGNSWRSSGHAIRAVDELGRQQLVSRWFEQQVKNLFPRELLLLLCTLRPSPS